MTDQPDELAEAKRWLLDRTVAARAEINRLRAVEQAAAALELHDAAQARVAELEDELDEALVEIRAAEAAVDGAGVVVLIKEHRVRGEEVVRLRARIVELEAEVAARKRSGEALNTECEQIGEKADEAWRALNPCIARVELLTAALTELTNAVVGWNGHPEPAHVMVMDAAAARARAVLAAGETEQKD